MNSSLFPSPVLEKILFSAYCDSDDFRVVLESRLVSKHFSIVITESNDLWRCLYLRKWKWGNPNLKLKSWYAMFKRKFLVHDEQQPSIEGCLKFECPLTFKDLSAGDNVLKRHCHQCGKDIEVINQEDAKKAHEQGKCVAIMPENWRLMEVPGHGIEGKKYFYNAKTCETAWSPPWDRFDPRLGFI